jgi:hypothetical protein
MTERTVWRALRQAQFRYRHPLLFTVRSWMASMVRKSRSNLGRLAPSDGGTR